MSANRKAKMFKKEKIMLNDRIKRAKTKEEKNELRRKMSEAVKQHKGK